MTIIEYVVRKGLTEKRGIWKMNKQEKIKSLFEEMRMGKEFELELTEDRAILVLKETHNKNKVWRDYSHSSMVKFLYELRQGFRYWNKGRTPRPE